MASDTPGRRYNHTLVVGRVVEIELPVDLRTRHPVCMRLREQAR